MNRLEIPGYYYDEDKKKYFKIEASRTAPISAAWSASSVKRRQLETHEAEARRKRLARDAGRIRRARILHEPLAGGCFLRREIGQQQKQAYSPSLEDARRESWAQGLRNKGDIRLWPDLGDAAGAGVTLMYIGGQDERSGLGVCYAALDDDSLMSSYIPRNDRDEIDFREAAVKYRNTDFKPTAETTHTPQLSSLKYHAPSHKMLVTSRQPGHPAGIGIFTPRLQMPGDGDDPSLLPLWRLGDDSSFTVFGGLPSAFKGAVVNTCAPAPASSRFICVAGTNMGIFTHHEQHDRTRLCWLTSFPPNHNAGKPYRQRRGGGTTHDDHRTFIPDDFYMKESHGEIFALDFLAQNPADVIIAAGRSRDICLIDTRCPEDEWTYIQHNSSVAHVRSVGNYEVLAAGPRSSMAIYDVRYNRYSPYQNNNRSTYTSSGGPSAGSSSAGSARRNHHQHRRAKDGSNRSSKLLPAVAKSSAVPVVEFPEYKNDPYLLHIGFDVLDHKDGGIVAAAHDDGAVGLYSLKSGRRLRVPAFDDKHNTGGGNNSVVKSLMFQTMPGDVHPSLFIGRGTKIEKFSFGRAFKRKGGGVVEGLED
ncbi:hypothetical protein B0H66DRAFT_564947 [Apodospora peruviana]|uniref:Myocyte-specific enhancer factor 2d n=1 Tax=Apodospora peruviana TaxID=516989 RepID=A0AAE0HYP4_9PEZI|nr:hypothetical protein B0H66DRAFT_564947 [Apodospora peruviana]